MRQPITYNRRRAPLWPQFRRQRSTQLERAAHALRRLREPLSREPEGRGPGSWRGPGGHCHPFAVGRAGPVGYSPWTGRR